MHRAIPRVHRAILSLACGLFWALRAASADALPSSPGLAPAETSPPPAAQESPAPDAARDPSDRFWIGALAGVGFPRPVSFEVFARLGRSVGLGAEYGLLPSVTFDGVSVSAWAASVDLRLFPFHGAFFFAVRGGYQHLDGSASVTIASVGSASAGAELDTWFLNPRLGFLWTVKYGFTIAIEAGVQLPLGSSFSSSLPSAIALQVRNSTPVGVLSGVLPTVDLLRVGMLF
jgi:hypothetical protein